MTSNVLSCFRCGASLAALTLPLSRRDMCPNCSVHLHVCRQCEHYDPRALGQCREEEAEEVLEKERVNFCEWFSPSYGAFDADAHSAHLASAAAAEALFRESGDVDSTSTSPSKGQEDPNDLFE